MEVKLGTHVYLCVSMTTTHKKLPRAQLLKLAHNHRSSLKRLTNLYLYRYFSSDGHTEDDISIMPIEEITFSVRANVTALRLGREDYWCRELYWKYIKEAWIGSK